MTKSPAFPPTAHPREGRRGGSFTVFRMNYLTKVGMFPRSGGWGERLGPMSKKSRQEATPLGHF